MKGLLFYGGMIVAAVLLFLWIRSAGEGLPAPVGQALAAPISSGPAIDTLFHALMSLAVIVVVARAVGGLFSARKSACSASSAARCSPPDGRALRGAIRPRSAS